MESVTTLGDPVLADPTLSGGQNVANTKYLGTCVPLRVLGGTALAIGGGHMPREFQAIVQILLILLIVAFAYSGCCHSRRNTWKNYVRPTTALTGALLATMYNRWDVAGVLIAADGLIGVQGRHTAALLNKQQK